MTAIDQPVEEVAAAKESWLATLGYFAKRYPLGAAGAVIVTMFVMMAVFAPWITQFDPTATDPRISLAYPSGAHILGGRDHGVKDKGFVSSWHGGIERFPENKENDSAQAEVVELADTPS